MVPAQLSAAVAHYQVGGNYRLAVELERSEISHDHQFAWLAEAWKSLPEHRVVDFPSPEHLRKRALIDCGYRSELIIDAGSARAATSVAAALRYIDEFALAFVRGGAVVVWRAESQRKAVMGAQRFQQSKTAILELIADMIGVTPSTLQRQAKPA